MLKPKADDYILMRCKIGQVFEHYATQSEFCKRANVAARREHDRIMQEVNRKRGSVAPAVKGRTFGDAVAARRTAIAPNLSPATVRQRESYLRQHIIPRFGDAAPHSIDVSAIQQFATDLRKMLSRKTVVNILGTIFVILDYAGRCGTPVSKVSFSDIELGTETSEPNAAFFTREQATRIVAESEETSVWPTNREQARWTSTMIGKARAAATAVAIMDLRRTPIGGLP